jgi:hypothetical protein
MLGDRKFADSSLEESGFEPLVPLSAETVQNIDSTLRAADL